MKNIAIIGHGEFAQVIKETIDNLNEYKFAGFIGKENNNEISYSEDNLKKLHLDNVRFLVSGVGNLCYLWVPEMIARYLKEGFIFPKIFHPSSVVSKTATVGDGTVILENAVVKSQASIGKFCIINSLAATSHNCSIDDFVHISLGAKIGGDCYIGKNSLIGINSSVIPGKKIGRNVIIGAGSVIIDNIPDNVVVVGNPGRVIKKNMYNDNKRRNPKK